MPQYMFLVYEPEVTADEQAERERTTPWLLELHDSLRAAGLLVSVGRLHTTDSATSVRRRGERTEIVDGPFAATKEALAGYYVLECADLDEALRVCERFPMTRWGTVEVRPLMSAAEWAAAARAAGVEVSDEEMARST